MSGYEKRDLRFPAIVAAFAGLAVLLGLVGILSGATLRGFAARLPLPGRPRPAPPDPRLQADPAADLRLRRAEEDASLNESAWIDRSRGEVRLPIERAMALILQRGLPTRAGAGRMEP